MGMMAKMRSLAPWFIVTVGGLFVLFMVLSDSKIGDSMGRRSNDIGEVNGETISYQEFANLMDRYREFQLQQNGQEISESQLEQFRDQVWETLVTQKLMEQKIKEFDLSVADKEIEELLTGPNPPQSVTQYFIDSTGMFNREAYDNAIRNPQNKTAVLQLEDQARQELLQEKLTSLVNASAFVSDEEIKRKFVDDNIKMNADYVVVTLSAQTDSTLQANDDEIANYYNSHKDDYTREESRKIKYVLFKTGASHGDTVGVEKNLKAILKKVQADSSGFKTYVDIYSDNPYAQDTLQISQISVAAQDLVANADGGSFVGPILTSEGYILYRVVKRIKSKEKLVKASHILIKEKADADAAYKELKAGADFAEMAKEKSQDPGSGRKGGDLGWFGKGQMVPEFEKAAFNGRIGRIQRPVKSEFGWHIIVVKNKTDKKYVVESIVNKIVPSASTTDRIYENASDFQYLAEEDGYATTAAQYDYQIIETRALKVDASSIPGLGANRSLLLYTFASDEGDIGPVFKFQSGYVVAMVSEVIEAGYQSLDDVKNRVKSAATREKKSSKELSIAQDIRVKIGDSGDLNLAKEVFSSARVASANNFSTVGSIPAIGREFVFSQTAFELPVNVVSEPVSGNRGSFIIRVTSKTAFDSISYSLQKNTIRTTLLNQKKSTLYAQWLVEIREEADIVDNRFNFYR